MTRLNVIRKRRASLSTARTSTPQKRPQTAPQKRVQAQDGLHKGLSSKQSAQPAALSARRKRSHGLSKPGQKQPTTTKRLEPGASKTASAPTTEGAKATSNWQQEIQADRAKSFAQQLKADTSQWALKPDDPELLEAMCVQFYESMEQAHAESTVRGDRYAWKFWEDYTKMLGTPAVRDDIAAIVGLDPFGHQREIWLQANAVSVWMPTIKGRGGRIQGTPESCGKRLDGMRRVHERLGLPTIPRRVITRKIKAEMRRYALKHGPEWLVPQRKNPMSFDTIFALTTLCKHTSWSAATWTDQSRQALEALIHTMAESGMRKAEVTSSNFSMLDLSFAHLMWQVDGVKKEASAEVLDSLVPNRDFAVLFPCSAKADPFTQNWGTKPIYLRYDPEQRINAATALLQLERMCLSRTQGRRRETPLFYGADTKAFSGKELDKILKEMLTELVSLGLLTQEEADSYSWHSFRATLATALLAANASGPQIQACCRWLSEKSVAIYAAFTADSYSRLIHAALQQDISTATRCLRPEGLMLPSGDLIQYDDAPHTQSLLDTF
jgi:hypothetical protein